MPVDVGYARHWTRQLDDSGGVTTATQVGAGASSSFDYLTDTFTGGILPGEDFVSEYEGFITVEQASSAAAFDLALDTVHSVNGKEFTTRQVLTLRLGRNQPQSIPLSHFNSRSQVRAGSFTDSMGKAITLTEEDVEADVEFTVSASIARQSKTAWSLTQFHLDDGKATWYQLVPSIPLPAFPAEGSRDGRTLRYDGDDLVWAKAAGPSAGGTPGSSYATVDQLKLSLRAPTSPSARSWADGEFDAQLERVLSTTSDLIDDYCGWPRGGFNPPADDAAAEVRTAEPSPRWRGSTVFTGPISSPDGVVVRTGWGALASTDWHWLHPGGPGEAWRHIELHSPGRGPVTVEAVYGWPAGPPGGVVDANLLWAAHIFKLESNPLGAEISDFGVVHMSHRPRGIDQLLAPYMRTGAVIA